jgi:hypothetical protein
MRTMTRARRVMAVGVAVVVTVFGSGACVPVVPRVEFSHSTFEGFDVISYVPAEPVAIAYVFHGTNGSAAFAEKVETVDFLNELVARGYGFIATDSTLRTGNRRWNVTDPSLQTNPDLARLTRLHQHLVSTTPVTGSTPIVGMGMSNGARFVSLFGQTWDDAGYPVDGIAMVMGRIAAPVESSGGLTVPTYFVTAENDFTSPPGPIGADYLRTVDAGTPAALHVARETSLSAGRFLRIPGIDSAEAQAVFDTMVDAGIWNSSGERVVSIEEAVARGSSVTLPASVASQRAEITDQCAVVLAVHQMRGDIKVAVADFLDAHI